MVQSDIVAESALAVRAGWLVKTHRTAYGERAVPDRRCVRPFSHLRAGPLVRALLRRVMLVFFRGTEPMQRRNNRRPVLDAEAVIHRVDIVNRELAALVKGVLVTIYVPPDCKVVL